MNLYKFSISSVLLVSCTAQLVFAQQSETSDSIATMIISVTRVDKEQLSVAQSVSVKTDQDIDKLQAIDISEVLNAIPGVGASGGFYGGQTIRGGSGGQVIINIDGVDQTASSNKGMSINPLSIDPMLVKQVEVLKGTGSALYGSGGIGGVIAIRTKNAGDLLEDEQNIGAFLRTRYNSNDHAIHNTAAVYGRSVDTKFDYLLTADGYRSELHKNNPAKNTKSRASRLSAKFGINLDPEQRLEITVKHSDSKFKNSVVDPDAVKNTTVQVMHTINRSDNLNMRSHLSYNTIKRNASMDFGGQQDSKVQRLQLDSQNSHFIENGQFDHEVTYGVSYLATKQTGFVDNQPDDFANANGDRAEIGAFLQDTVSWSKLTATGAIRYVNYAMQGRDAAYDMSEKKLLPSLGLTYKATPWLNLYASYGHDFRAPSIDDMYTARKMPLWGMEIVPNPNLKPEQSINRELGFALHTDGLFKAGDNGYLRFSYFDQNVKNLIELTGPVHNSGTGLMEYTSSNVKKANRSGLELEASYNLENFSASVAIDKLRVKDKATDKVTKYPKTLHANASYTFNQELSLAWLADGASQSDKSGGGYLIHGLRAKWQGVGKAKGLELSAGVSNAFDREYTNEYGGKGRDRAYTLGLAYKFN